jgi:hypothetical protein
MTDDVRIQDQRLKRERVCVCVCEKDKGKKMKEKRKQNEKIDRITIEEWIGKFESIRLLIWTKWTYRYVNIMINVDAHISIVIIDHIFARTCVAKPYM